MTTNNGLVISRRRLLVGSAAMFGAAIMGSLGPLEHTARAFAAEPINLGKHHYNQTALIRMGPVGDIGDLESLFTILDDAGYAAVGIDDLVQNMDSGRSPQPTFALEFYGSRKGDLYGLRNLLNQKGVQAAFFVDPNDVEAHQSDYHFFDSKDLAQLVGDGHAVGLLTQSVPDESYSDMVFRLFKTRLDLQALTAKEGNESDVAYVASDLPLFVNSGSTEERYKQDYVRSLFSAGFTTTQQEPDSPLDTKGMFAIPSYYWEVTPDFDFNPSIEVPVLMYHRVTQGPTQESIWVSQQQLRDHFKVLRSRGYESITMDELIDYTEERRPIPEHAFVAIFDDNWQSFFTYAAPIAREFGFTVTHGLIATAGYDQPHEYEQHAQLMREGIVDVQSHTVTHPLNPSLTAISDESVRWELEESKRRIENGLQIPIDHFIAPGGSYTTRVMDIAKDVGYRSYLTAWGDQGVKLDDNPFGPLPRVQMLARNSLSRFNQLIEQSSDGI